MIFLDVLVFSTIPINNVGTLLGSQLVKLKDGLSDDALDLPKLSKMVKTMTNMTNALNEGQWLDHILTPRCLFKG